MTALTKITFSVAAGVLAMACSNSNNLAKSPSESAPISETTVGRTSHSRPSEAIEAQAIVAASPTDPIVLGYFTNWAHTRNAPYDFRTSDVNPALFSHLAYAFATIEVSADKETYELTGTNPDDETLYKEVIALKAKNPKLSVVLSVGGWAMNDKPTEWVFTSMAENAERRGHFIRQSIRYLRERGFDGLDIDWEFPGAPDRGGRPEDKENFTKLLREFRTAMHEEAVETGKKELLLTIAAPAGPLFAGHLELDKIHEPLDFINVMTYDYHGEWETVTGANAPLKDSVGLDLEETMAMYRAAGTPAKKLILGLATYARGWGGVEKAEIGANSSKKLEWKPQAGDALTAYEIEGLVKSGKLEGKWDEATSTPFAYDKATKSFFSYDSARSYEAKLVFLEKAGLGGAMFWAVDLDDYKNGYPLIGQVSKRVLGTKAEKPTK